MRPAALRVHVDRPASGSADEPSPALSPTDVDVRGRASTDEPSGRQTSTKKPVTDAAAGKKGHSPMRAKAANFRGGVSTEGAGGTPVFANDPVRASQRRWLDVEPAKRKAVVKSLFVDRPVTEQLFALFDRVRNARKSLPEPQHVLLTGDTGTGKTSLLKQYLARNPPTRVDCCLRQPALYVELLSQATPVGAVKALLKGLDDPSGGKGTLNELIDRTCDQIDKQLVEIILADEWQHLTETGPIRLNRSADVIKQITKRTNTPIVMAGMPSASSLIDNNSQLRGLTPHRRTIDTFSYGTREERLLFREFLLKVDDVLPFTTVAGLADPENARQLFEATRGHLRPLMVLIRQAATHGIDRGADKMEAEDLRHGYDQTPGVDYDKNPF